MNGRLTAFVIIGLVGAACAEPHSQPQSDAGGMDVREPVPDLGAGDTDVDGDAGAQQVVEVFVEPGTLSVALGTTATLKARAVDEDGGSIDAAVSWTSSNSAVAEVTDTGVVIARALGDATVSAEVEGVTGSAEVTVTGPAVERVVVTPTNRMMAVGDTVMLTVTLFDALNAPIEDPRPTTFASSDEAVITVDDGGLVTAVGGGAATVTTEVEGHEATSAFTVTTVTIERIELDARTARLVRGDAVLLSATVFDSDGMQADVPVEWSSSDPGVAVVDDTGLVTGVSEGIATVSAGVGEVVAAAEVTVVFDFAQVTAGGAHACGIVEGIAYCWGDASDLQLGHDQGAAPARVQTDLRFLQLAAGASHTCGIALDGKAYCWGRGDEGQRGDGSMLPSALPAPVAGNHIFTAIAAGENATCAVESGQLCCWGAYGASTSLTPVVLGPYVAPAVGLDHVCTVQGTAGHCRGSNAEGQLGINSFGGSFTSWQPVTGGFTFDALAAGARHTCGTTTGGATACWGDNTLGQVGDGTNDPRATPILISAGVGLSRLTAGDAHTCGLSAAGALYCWGRNDRGQLGEGTSGGFRNMPVAASTAVAFGSVEAGSDFTCAVSLDGDPYCWGNGDLGQLGSGASTDAPSPVNGL